MKITSYRIKHNFIQIHSAKKYEEIIFIMVLIYFIPTIAMEEQQMIPKSIGNVSMEQRMEWAKQFYQPLLEGTRKSFESQGYI